MGKVHMAGIVIGSVCSLCAMLSDAFSGTRKKYHDILAVQILSQFFYGAGYLILKGYSSVAQNIVSVFRNLAAMKGVRSRAVEWTLILAGIVLGIAFNNMGLFGLLPVAANLEYSISVFRFKDNERSLKLAFIINMAMYAVFNLGILNVVGMAACLFIAVTTALSLLREARTRKAVSPAFSFDPETQEAVIRSSICSGEKVAGFKNKKDGRFTEVMLIRSAEDEEEFKQFCRVETVRTEY